MVVTIELCSGLHETTIYYSRVFISNKFPRLLAKREIIVMLCYYFIFLYNHSDASEGTAII